MRRVDLSQIPSLRLLLIPLKHQRYKSLNSLKFNDSVTFSTTSLRPNNETKPWLISATLPLVYVNRTTIQDTHVSDTKDIIGITKDTPKKTEIHINTDNGYIIDVELGKFILGNINKMSEEQTIAYLKTQLDQKHLAQAEDIIQLMINYNTSKKFEYTHQLYKMYYPLFSLNSTFIECSIRCCFYSKRYKEVEELLKSYLTFPNQTTSLIKIAVITYIRIRNIEVAKQLFYQFITSKAALDPQILDVVLREMLHSASLSSIKFVLDTWIQAELPITRLSYSLGLEAHLMKGTAEDVTKYELFLRSTNSHTDRFIYMVKLCHEAKSISYHMEDCADFFRKLDMSLYKYRLNSPKKLPLFYYKLLKIFIYRDHKYGFDEILKRIEKDKAFSRHIHILICKHYLKKDSFAGIIKYLRTMKKQNQRLSSTFIKSLYESFQYNHPHLLEYFVLVIRGWLDKLPSGTKFEHSIEIDRLTEDIKSSDFDYVETNEKSLLKFMSKKPSTEVFQEVSEMLRAGYTPSFKILLEILKLLLKRNEVPLALRIEELMKRLGYPISANVQILWLKHEISKDCKNQESKSEISNSCCDKIRQFIFANEHELCAASLLALSSLAFAARGYDVCEELALKSNDFYLNPKQKSLVLLNLIRSKSLLGDIKGLQMIKEKIADKDFIIHPLVKNRLYNFKNLLVMNQVDEKSRLLYDEIKQEIDSKLVEDSEKTFELLKDMVLVLKDWDVSE